MYLYFIILVIFTKHVIADVGVLVSSIKLGSKYPAYSWSSQLSLPKLPIRVVAAPRTRRLGGDNSDKPVTQQS